MTAKPTSNAAITVPSRTPRILPSKNKTESATDRVTQLISKITLILPKSFLVFFGNNSHKCFGGIENYISYATECNTKSYDNNAYHQQYELNIIIAIWNILNNPYTEVCEIAKEDGEWNLQKLNQFEITA